MLKFVVTVREKGVPKDEASKYYVSATSKGVEVLEVVPFQRSASGTMYYLENRRSFRDLHEFFQYVADCLSAGLDP